MRRDKVNRAEKFLKIKFSQRELLKEALTHPSFYLEKEKKRGTYERLEFLGDTVLNFVITDFLFHRFPQFKEGDLAKLRANLVNSELLAKIGERIGLGKCLFMSPAIEQEGGRRKASILGDSFEAILGAVYLDQGFKIVKEFILATFKDDIFAQAARSEFSDSKTALQELTVSKLGVFPEYKIVKEKGPIHQKTFFAEVKIEGKIWGQGKGTSKKRAELSAAEKALKSFRKKEKEEEK